MQLLNDNITEVLNEEFFVESFNLNNKTILELGCGSATFTKKIALNGENRKIIACEVDEIQHKKNLQLNISNIEFKLCAAENILVEDNSIDMIFMFKSFHHIPVELIKKALSEIKRVLKPNALAYISEPLFMGEQNELIAMFHDEKEVREEAFKAIKESVDNGEFKLFNEIFFNSEITYENFEDFEKKQMNLTYNNDHINEELKNKIKERFNFFTNGGQKTTFLKPFRVDILQKIV